MIRFNKESKISLNPFAALSNSGLAAQGALELISKGISLDEVAKITGIDMEKLGSLELGLKSGASILKEMEAIELIEVRGIGALKHFVTKDSIIYAKALVASMCNLFGDARSEAIIERAIIQGISEHGQALDITKLAGVLELLKNHKGEPIDGASGMADSLFPYTTDGIHGRFFSSSSEGAQNANFNSLLTVFELEELVNDKPLLSIVLQVVLMQITMQFLCGDRSKRFMLIVDEAWMILDHAAAFLERFARTVRKYGGSLVVCTQDLSSFTNDCGTKACQAAVLESSTWKMILAQKEEGVATFAKSQAYEKYIGLISSIRKCSANKFSEVLISTNGINIVGRLAVDAYSTALFSTEHDDFNFLLKKEQEGFSKHEAIMLLSKKYGKLPELEFDDDI
jgi:type IV secretory pathway VirB4 component